MIEDKFPPQFCYQKRGIVLDEALCSSLPPFSVLSELAAYIVGVREKYRPTMNYDLSGRSSRGLFIGIPECGVDALGFLENHNFSEVAIATFSPERRSAVSRNCYLWGCESRVSLTSLNLMDALSRWYTSHAVRSPVYIDVSQDIQSIGVIIQRGISISINSVDLKCILEKALEVGVPFICLRIHPEDEPIIRSYNLVLKEVLVNSSIESNVSSTASSLLVVYISFINSTDSSTGGSCISLLK